MKIISIFFALTFSLKLLSQDKVFVSYDKTVLLQFSATIDNAYCGSPETVGVTKRDNKILLRAKEEYFEETNLIVECSDGAIFALDLIFNNTPKKTVYNYKTESNFEKSVAKDTDPVVAIKPKLKPDASNVPSNSINGEKSPGNSFTSSVAVKNSGELVYNQLPYLKRIGQRHRGKIIFYVGGIWYLDSKLYFRVSVKNESSIEYKVDYIRFLIKPIGSGIKVETQQAEKLKPLSIFNESSKNIVGGETVTYVFEFNRFTISEKKGLYLEFFEAGGERNIELLIESKELLIAKTEL